LSLTFFVPGLPVPQGSMRSFHHAKTGRVITTSDNPNLKSWRTTVLEVARAARAGAPAMGGPVEIAIAFRFPRLKGHYGRRGLLPSAPQYPITSRNDLDKLVRGICDALTNAGVWRDDGQVVVIRADKGFCVESMDPGATVCVTELVDAPVGGLTF
jgi:Holliday junction resolvase RusA-like endonuclease